MSRTDLPGTGNGLGFGASFTRTDGSTGEAATIYFATSPRETADPTPPSFTPAYGALNTGRVQPFSLAGPLSHRRKTVVDEDVRTIDEARLVAGEEQRGARHFFGLAKPPLLHGDGGFRHIDSEC